jgi:hypothetical protein
MRYSVIENTTIRTSKNEYHLLPGQTIALSEDAAAKLLKIGKIKPATQETAEERRESLEEVMAAMVQETCNRIIGEYKTRGIPSYKLIPENEHAENEITRIYRAVLDGREKLEAYKKACDNWLKVATSWGAFSNIIN